MKKPPCNNRTADQLIWTDRLGEAATPFIEYMLPYKHLFVNIFRLDRIKTLHGQAGNFKRTKKYLALENQ